MSPSAIGARQRRARRFGVPLLTAVSAAVVLLPASPANAATESSRFVTPGCLADQFTVPAGVTSLDVTAQGGPGTRASTGGTPGIGALLSATIAVTPGERPLICVDFGGRWPGASSFSSGRGGGLAGISIGGSLATAELVAGGGGGAGAGPAGADGGDAGLPGAAAGGGGSSTTGTGGGGGTQSGPGAGGTNPAAGGLGDGYSGVGNDGGSVRDGPSGVAGGGGGAGGWFGGGGGATGDSEYVSGAGGGGGSSYCAPALSCNASLVAGASYVEISYQSAPAPTTTTVTADPATPVTNEDVRFVAHVATATSGTVDFELEGEPVDECSDVAVDSVTNDATCDTWIPWEWGSRDRELTLTARYAGDADFEPSGGELRFDPLASIVEVMPDPVAFGDVVVGETTTRVVTVTNTGDGDLEINEPNGISIYGRGVDLHAAPASVAGRIGASVAPVNDTDFTIVESDCIGATVAPGASCTATVAFRPTAPGARPGLLRVSGNFANDFTPVVLSGVGVEAPVPDPDPPVPPVNDPTPPADNPTPPAREPTPPSTPAAIPPSTTTPPPARGAVFSPRATPVLVVQQTGGVNVPVSCPAGAACSVDGTLTLTVAGGAKARAAAAKTTVLLRFSGIKVAASKTKTLSLRLPAKFVKQQQAKGVRKLRTTLTLRTTHGNGRAVTTRKQVTLLIPRAKPAQSAKPEPARRPSFTG